MNEICVFCLSKDRILNSIEKIGWINCFPYISLEESQYILYLQNESLLRVCFECKARIDNIHKFVQQSMHSLRILKEYWACSTQATPLSRTRLARTTLNVHDTNYDVAFIQNQVGIADEEDKDILKHVVKVEFEGQSDPCIVSDVPPTKLSTSIKYEQVDANSFIDDAFDSTGCEEAGVIRKTKKEGRKKSKSSKRPRPPDAPPTPATPAWASVWQTRGVADAPAAAEPAAHAPRYDEKATVYRCHICHLNFDSDKDLQQHTNAHYLVFKCAQCEYETTQLSSIESHAEGHQFDSADEMPLNKCKEWRCKKCKCEFGDAAALKSHQVACAQFKCDFCDKVFGHRTSKYSHMDLHHKPQEQVSCKHCNKTFKNKYAIKSHLLKHRREYTGGAYSCGECSQNFRSAVAYKQHFYKLLRDRPSAHACSHCPAAFAAAAELARHVTGAHLPAGAYTCDACHKWFIHKRALSLHWAAVHERAPRPPPPRDKICDVCGKGFTSTTILRNHQRSHSGERPYACSLCPAAFAHTGSLYTHTRLVHKKRRRKDASLDAQLFPCAACGKEFTSEPSMRVHYEFFHLKKSKFVCELCNKMFISAWNLKNHKKMLHGVNRTRSYPCAVCGREFFRVDALKSHRLIHSEERTFMCSECGKTFKQQAALYTHNKLVHRGVKRAPPAAGGKRPHKLDVDAAAV